MRALWRASIWHPEAIEPDEWKFRSLKRVWLPFYDVVAIAAGLWATAFGSPILRTIFPEAVVDVAGFLFAIAATVCLCGVAFPALWLVEFFGKVTVLFLLAGYAACVLFYRRNPDDPASVFVVFILVLAIIPPFIRLSILGEEWKERRASRATAGRESS